MKMCLRKALGPCNTGYLSETSLYGAFMQFELQNAVSVAIVRVVWSGWHKKYLS